MSAEVWAEVTRGSLVALVGGGIGALLTLPQRRRVLDAQARDTGATADSRIMSAAATLVEQHGAQLPQLIQRITQLEGARDQLSTALDSLRVEQDEERIELAEWRSWGDRQLEWSGAAVQAIRSLGGDIGDPPSPPRTPGKR